MTVVLYVRRCAWMSTVHAVLSECGHMGALMCMCYPLDTTTLLQNQIIPVFISDMIKHWAEALSIHLGF